MSPARNSVVKFLAAVLCVAAVTVGAVSLTAVNQARRCGGYMANVTPELLGNRMLSGLMYQDFDEAANYYALVMNGQSWTENHLADYAERFDSDSTNFYFIISDYQTGEELMRSGDAGEKARYSRSEDYYITAAELYDYGIEVYNDGDNNYYYYDTWGNFLTTQAAVETGEADEPEQKAPDDGGTLADDSLRHVVITGYIRSDLSWVRDKYAQCADLADLLYAYRYTAITAAAVSAVVFLVLFLFLMYASGRRAHTEEIRLRFADRIPWDLFLAIAVAAAVGAGTLYLICSNGSFHTLRQYAYLAAVAAAGGLLFIIVTLSFAARCKRVGWWKNSLVCLCAGWMGKVLHHPLRRLIELLRAIPLVWKTLLLGVVLAAAEVLCLCQLYWYGFALPILLLNIVFGLIVLSAVVNMKKLQTACRTIADGDLDYRVDTSHMYLDYKAHGEDLNRIGSGLSAAVEERLKSERFRTELITNVSHDLKTPLTSIVNYADLLSKLELPEAARAYVEVLQRQSARLKKLTEDLVEASKASTGNLSVEIAPVNLGELLVQVAGEYEERFQKAGVLPVVAVPGENLSALGDGRYLWRIMDNLFSNVCKYALTGTRVYIDAVVQGEQVVMAVKNISRERLNISADELMERFVRGDASRNTEGSGLGLSIAQSLAELMGGRLSISVDGDLFKAEVSLPLASGKAVPD